MSKNVKPWIVPIDPTLRPLVIKNKAKNGININRFVEMAIREKLNKAS